MLEGNNLVKFSCLFGLICDWNLEILIAEAKAFDTQCRSDRSLSTILLI